MNLEETAVPNNLPPVPRPPVKNWDLRRKIVAFTAAPALLVATLIFSIPAAFFIEDPLNIPITVALGITVAAEVLVIVWAIFFGHIRPVKEAFGLVPKKLWYPLMGFGIGILFWGVLQGIGILMPALTGEELESSDTSMQLAEVGSGIGAALFLILVVALLVPTIEEFLFRGVIVGALNGTTWHKKHWLSIGLSAVSFGILHFQGLASLTDAAIMIWITIMGGFFAWLFLKTGTIWASVGAHIGYNLVTSIIIIAGLA